MDYDIYRNNTQPDFSACDTIECGKSTDSNDATSSTSQSATKRKRTKYSFVQLEVLENEFKSNVYLSGRRRSELAKQLCLKEAHIKVWFQNRRMKHKRDADAGRFHNKALNKNMNAQNQHNALVHRLLSYSHNIGCGSRKQNNNYITKKQAQKSVPDGRANANGSCSHTNESLSGMTVASSKIGTHSNGITQLSQPDFHILNELDSLDSERVPNERHLDYEKDSIFNQNGLRTCLYNDNNLNSVENSLNFTTTNCTSSSNYRPTNIDCIPKTFTSTKGNNCLEGPSETNSNNKGTVSNITDVHLLNLDSESPLQYESLTYDTVCGFDDIWFN